MYQMARTQIYYNLYSNTQHIEYVTVIKSKIWQLFLKIMVLHTKVSIHHSEYLLFPKLAHYRFPFRDPQIHYF